MTYQDLSKCSLQAVAKYLGTTSNTLSKAMHKPIPGQIYDENAINEVAVAKVFDACGIKIKDMRLEEFLPKRRGTAKTVPNVGERFTTSAYNDEKNGDHEVEVVATSSTHIAVLDTVTDELHAMRLATWFRICKSGESE
jgi:hypothetical protein